MSSNVITDPKVIPTDIQNANKEIEIFIVTVMKDLQSQPNPEHSLFFSVENQKWTHYIGEKYDKLFVAVFRISRMIPENNMRLVPDMIRSFSTECEKLELLGKTLREIPKELYSMRKKHNAVKVDDANKFIDVFVKRFSNLHSWYKHLPLEGHDFYFYIGKGQQARNAIHPDIDDEYDDCYFWHYIHGEDFETFKKENLNIKLYGPIKINSFFGGGLHLIPEDKVKRMNIYRNLGFDKDKLKGNDEFICMKLEVQRQYDNVKDFLLNIKEI